MKKGGKKTGQEKTEVEQKPEVELSVQELMQQEAAKRRAAMGYDEENTELEEESVVKSLLWKKNLNFPFNSNKNNSSNGKIG